MRTGAYIRFDRNGKWDSYDIAELTQEELDKLAEMQPDRGWMWAKFLVKWMQEHIAFPDEDE